MTRQDRRSTPRDRERLFKTVIVTATGLALAAVLLSFWKALSSLPDGPQLQQAAWQASFAERGLPVPESGIREGFDDQRIRAQRRDPPEEWVGDYRRDPVLGWREAEVYVPGLLDTDALGRQTASAATPEAQVLILGGSVAFGGAASSLESTYFHRLVRLLEERGLPVRVTVGATGAWRSHHELQALRTRDRQLRPDLLVFLNGLNDLTNAPPEVPYPERIDAYLENMGAAADLGLQRGSTVLFALQPTLADKVHKTALEQRIEESSATIARPEDVRRAYQRLRLGLGALAERPGVQFADLSGVFDTEEYTTFCDLWHFGDPGHEILAQQLADRVAPLLRALPPRGERRL